MDLELAAAKQGEEYTEIRASLLEAYERGKVDINFFAALAMPSVCLFSLPLFYVAVWGILVKEYENDGDDEKLERILRFALGLPRGHAKTTFIKILIAWLIVYDKASFILIVCASSDLAENLLADIHDILSSPNITSIYGDWEQGLAIDSSDTKKASYHGRPVILVAKGWKSGIRGMNLKNERPDFIFCDDVQTKENAASVGEKGEQLKLLQELVGTIFKTLAHRGKRIIVYVGNMYGEDCILDKFRKSRSWTSLITGAILENGQPLWPELVSLEELKESYEHDEALGLAHIWFAEIMNDPQSIAKSILPFPLPDSDISEIIQHDGAFITIDPAGFRKTSDDNVIALHFKFDDKGYVGKTIKGILDPKELIFSAINLALENDVCLIAVESVAYQQTLCFWIDYFLKEFHIDNITVVELKPHGRSKEQRIRQFVAECYGPRTITEEGIEVFHPSYYILDSATRRDFTWQASLYKIGKKENKDDLLDAIAYGLDVRNEYWHLIHNLNPTSLIDHSVLSVEYYNTPF